MTNSVSIIELTRDNLVTLVREYLQNTPIAIAALERQASVPKDSIRDFLRGKVYIPRADKLQKIMAIITPGVDIYSL